MPTITFDRFSHQREKEEEANNNKIREKEEEANNNKSSNKKREKYTPRKRKMNAYLIHFAQVHAEFRLPELKSVLEHFQLINKVDLNEDAYRLDVGFQIFKL